MSLQWQYWRHHCILTNKQINIDYVDLLVQLVNEQIGIESSKTAHADINEVGLHNFYYEVKSTLIQWLYIFSNPQYEILLVDISIQMKMLAIFSSIWNNRFSERKRKFNYFHLLFLFESNYYKIPQIIIYHLTKKNLKSFEFFNSLV